MSLEFVNPDCPLHLIITNSPNNAVDTEETKVSEIARSSIEEFAALRTENAELKRQVRGLTWQLRKEEAQKNIAIDSLRKAIGDSQNYNR
jgi:regulator of replication initiation timing